MRGLRPWFFLLGRDVYLLPKILFMGGEDVNERRVRAPARGCVLTSIVPLSEPASVTSEGLMRDTWPLLANIAFPSLCRGRLDTLPVNIGFRRNQFCVHCHGNAGPGRTEAMD